MKSVLKFSFKIMKAFCCKNLREKNFVLLYNDAQLRKVESKKTN